MAPLAVLASSARVAKHSAGPGETEVAEVVFELLVDAAGVDHRRGGHAPLPEQPQPRS